jgi:hypothetical protein
MRLIDFHANPNPAAAHEGPLTVSTTAVTLLSLLTGSALAANTVYVRVSVEAADVRYTVQGTTPTSTLGRRLTADSSVLLSRHEADLCKLIRAAGTDATIQVQQYIA